MMKLRQYFRLLRPGRSLLFLSLAGFAFGPMAFFFSRWPTSLCLVVAVGLPAVLGFFLAGAAHELLHQPSILLLPRGLEGIRKITIIGMFLSAAALAGIVALAGSPFPPLATFGLAAAFLALPCTSRHLPANLNWPLAFLLVWAGTIYFAEKGYLVPTMVEAPAACLIGGVAVAAASIAFGFFQATGSPARRHAFSRAARALPVCDLPRIRAQPFAEVSSVIGQTRLARSHG